MDIWFMYAATWALGLIIVIWVGFYVGRKD
jgi:hypothetical protein